MVVRLRKAEPLTSVRLESSSRRLVYFHGRRGVVPEGLSSSSKLVDREGVHAHHGEEGAS